MIQFVAQNWHSLMWSAIILGAAIGIALIVHYIVFQVLPRLARREGGVLSQSLVKTRPRPRTLDFSAAGRAGGIARPPFASDCDVGAGTYCGPGSDRRHCLARPIVH